MKEINYEKIIEEHKLQFSGSIDESTAVELGKLAGLDNIVLGSVALFGSSSHPQKHSTINSRNNIYLTISKSTHHPTNKKPHECGA